MKLSDDSLVLKKTGLLKRLTSSSGSYFLADLAAGAAFGARKTSVISSSKVDGGVAFTSRERMVPARSVAISRVWMVGSSDLEKLQETLCSIPIRSFIK